MIFNSLEFSIFLPLVFLIYWGFRNSRRCQNAILVVASYVFYGWWDWRFLFLIAASSLCDFIVGILLSDGEGARRRKMLLATSLVINLGLLGFFKYYNFFVESFEGAFAFFGNKISLGSLEWILPVGISFYTFQTLSYSIDLYRRKIEPVRDPVAFFAFVSFFPQLVAGPIERASNLAPQFLKERSFKYQEASDGMRQILWGLFKKIVIADNCAILVNQVFASHSEVGGGVLLLAVILFSFQIYGDFSGYSDIAIGASRLFGFQLKQNFAYPYFSRNIAEFWRRWHISLSSWFKDYVYIPMGGSRVGRWLNLRNAFVVFLLSGFWHGANWTFVFWGGLHALFLLPSVMSGRNRVFLEPIERKKLPSAREFIQMLTTFVLVSISWVFFRAESLPQAFDYLGRMLTTLHLDFPGLLAFVDLSGETLVFILVMLVVEWVQRHRNHGFDLSALRRQWLRWLIYYLTVYVLYYYGGDPQDFIYFQF